MGGDFLYRWGNPKNYHVSILFAAFIHASWNFLLKKSGGGTGLITAASILSLAVYAPLVIVATWLSE